MLSCSVRAEMDPDRCKTASCSFNLYMHKNKTIKPQTNKKKLLILAKNSPSQSECFYTTTSCILFTVVLLEASIATQQPSWNASRHLFKHLCINKDYNKGLYSYQQLPFRILSVTYLFIMKSLLFSIPSSIFNKDIKVASLLSTNCAGNKNYSHHCHITSGGHVDEFCFVTL